MEENNSDTKKDLGNNLESFFNKYFNLILLGTLIFAFILRFKYMNINAAVWWDEADYLSLAKHFAFGFPEQAAPWRARFLPMVWSVFYSFGANETFIRFIEVLVSGAGVYLTYVLGKTLYNKKVGLLAAIMLAVYFEHLFWSARISLGVYGLTIWALMGILFWKGYHQNNKKYLLIVGALYGLGIYTYDSLGFFALFIFVFMLLTTKFKFLKDKRIWYVILAAVIAIMPIAIYHYVEFKDTFGESSNVLYSIYPRIGRFATADFNPSEESNLDWQRPKGEVISEAISYFTQMPYLMKWPFFIALLLGLTLLGNLILGFDLILKGKSGNLKKDLYIILWALSLMIPMGLVVATTGFMFEPRLIFPAMPALFVIVGIGFMKLYSLISKYNKQLAIVAVVILLVLGVQMQLSFANNLINAKKDSFFQHNVGGTWLKEHTKVGDVIVGCGLAVNLIYYTEREFKSFGSNATRADELVEKYKPKYFVMDAFDPGCTIDYPSMYREKFIPVQVYFLDPAKTMPIMIIYEVRY